VALTRLPLSDGELWWRGGSPKSRCGCLLQSEPLRRWVAYASSRCFHVE